MEDSTPSSTPAQPGAPITEADLHAYVDGQLTPARRADVDRHLERSPDALTKVHDWRMQNEQLRALLAPALTDPVPSAWIRPGRSVASRWGQLAAGIVIAVVSAGAAWTTRGMLDERAAPWQAAKMASTRQTAPLPLNGFAQRAVVAHVVYSPDVRRPVEVSSAQEDQLVAWLTKRLGTTVKPPNLQHLGYELIGGRLLPGERGPVAQLMYHDALGERVTLYVTQELPSDHSPPETFFRYGQDGPVRVFYWVDGPMGYAISGGSSRGELLRISQEVYRQLRA